ncbi:hypothetical protein BSL78_01708 [Apostichopus japonicus]|uniref:Uncharacterized protein n=1 Tax=Stichopus japonicus TaxID=307972 RepID=A0A2G8LME7_STIJA|nr:hypothetical protein BSL78_01708 [Apostichopus japonicus]
MRILREDFGNQSRTCTRAKITVNRSYNGKSLGCQVEQYTSLNTSLPVYVSWKEERGLNDQATNNRWKAIIACVDFYRFTDNESDCKDCYHCRHELKTEHMSALSNICQSN